MPQTQSVLFGSEENDVDKMPEESETKDIDNMNDDQGGDTKSFLTAVSASLSSENSLVSLSLNISVLDGSVLDSYEAEGSILPSSCFLDDDLAESVSALPEVFASVLKFTSSTLLTFSRLSERTKRRNNYLQSKPFEWPPDPCS